MAPNQNTSLERRGEIIVHLIRAYWRGEVSPGESGLMNRRRGGLYRRAGRGGLVTPGDPAPSETHRAVMKQ
jgi:hypothetical protein